jgi:HAD superfamily hydrolase (TIGR01662 family)
MLNKKLLIFDLDGTVRRTRSGCTFPKNPDDWELIPEAVKVLELHKHASLIVGATNQKGISLGFVSDSDVIAGIRLTMQFFPFDYVMVCPDEGQNCFSVGVSPMGKYVKTLDTMPFGHYRKPGSGMLDYAIRNSGFAKEETLMIGDWHSDKEAAAKASVEYLDISQIFKC